MEKHEKGRRAGKEKNARGHPGQGKDCYMQRLEGRKYNHRHSASRLSHMVGIHPLLKLIKKNIKTAHFLLATQRKYSLFSIA